MKEKSAGTAKIYQFPKGGRAAWDVRKPSTASHARPIAWASLGGASYHEAAIRAAEDARER